MIYREPEIELELFCSIEIITVSAGYAVTEEGYLRGRFDNLEAAYQEALAICAALFDVGIPARVFQTNTDISWGRSPRRPHL